MHNIQLVKIQPEERLAASSELNPASCLVTGCGEARGMGYWAATQVKGLSPEIFIVPEADVVVLTEGSTLIADSPIGTWQGDASPAGSETVARYQTDIMGTREAQSVLLSGVCAIKPINGKTVQTTLWESDQFIVPEKQGNACRGKGLAGARWPGRDTPSILRYGQGVSTKLWSITLRERRGCTPEEPDEGKLQVRFCEGAHSNLGAITSKKRCAMGSTRRRKPTQNDWSNVLRKEIYEFNTGWHYYLIIVLAGVLSLISVGYMGWNIYHSQTLLSYWNVFLGILIFAMLYNWYAFLTESVLSIDTPWLAYPDDFRDYFIFGLVTVPSDITNLEDISLLPFMAWAPAVGYFTTAFLLNFVSWLVAALIWGIIIGGCISLAVIGSRKEARSKNPLKGILDVHEISK